MAKKEYLQVKFEATELERLFSTKVNEYKGIFIFNIKKMKFPERIVFYNENDLTDFWAYEYLRSKSTKLRRCFNNASYGDLYLITSKINLDDYIGEIDCSGVYHLIQFRREVEGE